MSNEAPQPERLSWSRVDLFHLCPQKYAYRYEEGLSGGQVIEYEGIDGDKRSLILSYIHPLAFGTALHAALASVYDGTAFEAVHCPCEDTCEFCERLYAKQGPKDTYRGRWMYKCIAQFLLHYPWDPDPVDFPREPRTRERGVALLHAYLDHWKRESFKVEAVEQEFEIPFLSDKCKRCGNEAIHSYHVDGYHKLLHHPFEPAVEFIYVGVIDLLARDASGALAPWDHKHTKWFGDMFDLQFRLSGQFTGYIEAAEAVMREPITRAWANGIRITSHAPEGADFKRIETFRTPEDRERWREEIREVYRLIQRYRAASFWPRHAPTACFAFNTRCEFYSLCASGAAAAEDIKRNNFIRAPRGSGWHDE